MTPDPTCETCSDPSCSAKDKRRGESDEAFAQRQNLAARLCRIDRKLIVLSGKGGVGKSTVAVNLACALAAAGQRVGLLDVDLHGPSVPHMLGIDAAGVHNDGQAMLPAEVATPGDLVKVMSIGMMLEDGNQAVVWRGPKKYGAIRQLLADVAWGDLDFLIVDCPPGTGDEPLAVAELLEGQGEAVVVTSPQELAVADVRRSLGFCRLLNMNIVGVIENFSAFVCPGCGLETSLFGSGGGERLAGELGVPFLGPIPIDPRVVQCGDDGRPVVLGDDHGPVGLAFGRLVRGLLEPGIDQAQRDLAEQTQGADQQTIAVPVAQGQLCAHFGHCEQFALFRVDRAQKRILDRENKTPPPHEPGVLPRWLGEQGADLIIAGGMGARAQGLFTSSGVQVVVGARAAPPDEVVQAYLEGALETGANICDH